MTHVSHVKLWILCTFLVFFELVFRLRFLPFGFISFFSALLSAPSPTISCLSVALALLFFCLFTYFPGFFICTFLTKISNWDFHILSIPVSPRIQSEASFSRGVYFHFQLFVFIYSP